MDNDKLARHLQGMGEKLENMTDAQVKDFAAKTAAKAILTPSERAGQARSKIPEQIAHLLNRIYQNERSQLQQKQGIIEGMPPGLFRELESFCQQNSTTFVPFDMLAGLKDQGVDPQQVLRDAAVKLADSAENVDCASINGPDGAPRIMLALGDVVYQAQRILNLFGWTFDDLKLNVRREIDIKEKEAKKK